MTLLRHNRKWIVLVYLINIFSLLMINRGVYSFQLFSFLLAVGFSLFLPIEGIVIEMAIFIPLGQLARIPNSLTAFPFLSIIIIIKALMKGRLSIKGSTLFSLFAVSIVGFISSLIQFGTVLDCLPIIVYLFMIPIIHNELISKNEYSCTMVQLMYCFLISMIITSIGSITLPKASEFLSAASTKSLYTTRNYGFSSVWDYGQNLVVCLGIVYVLFKERRINVLVALLLTAFYAYFIYTSMLFTALAGIAVLIFYVIYDSLDKNKKYYSLKLLGSLIGIVLTFYISYFVLYKNMVIIRGASGDNGRIEIWKFYLSHFVNNLKIMLIGIGPDCIIRYANGLGVLSTHNVLIEKLIEYGLLGFSFLLIYIIDIYKNSRNNRLKRRVLPSLLLFAMGCFQGLTGNQVIILLLILAYLPSNDELAEMDGCVSCEF